MFRQRSSPIFCAGIVVATIAASTSGLSQEQSQPQQQAQEVERRLLRSAAGATNAEDADCAFFAAGRGLRPSPREDFALGRLAERVSGEVGFRAAAAARTATPEALADGSNGLIDKWIFAKLQAENVKPADKISDYEFIRRASIDLTGRIPVRERVESFVADKSSDKRQKLVEELLASPLWVDKWTYYFGDRLKNTRSMNSTGTLRQTFGREAFNQWIRESLQGNKGWDAMARELIAAKGDNSWEKGEINWLVGGRVTGGPNNDIWDQQAANIAETFLGINYANCVLCHNGRFHLDALSLWGRNATRAQMWGMSAFLSKTTMARSPDVNGVQNLYYWRLVENANAANYPLGSTTGNRPARTIVNNVRNVAPVYPFSGRGPNAGEPYRDALAREVTSDPQFARASVNYIWKEFFGRGIVDPVNQFDIARLDPDHPPSDCPPETPCTLQPSHPELLRDLAADFAAGGYQIKDLMRKIVNSEAYQMSSRYNGTWEARFEPMFARHLPRRMWGEELADSMVLASNIPNPYTYQLDADNRVTKDWAMQMPEPNTTGAFVAAFIPGNRDDESRRDDGAVQQGLNLMNSTFAMNRLRATGTGSTSSLIQQVVLQESTDEALVNRLYMTVLSRPPGTEEKAAAIRQMQTGSGNRTARASSLLWALFNKVDFIYNY